MSHRLPNELPFGLRMSTQCGWIGWLPGRMVQEEWVLVGGVRGVLSKGMLANILEWVLESML